MPPKRRFSSSSADDPQNGLSIGPIFTSLSSSLPWTSRTFTPFHLQLLQHRPLTSSRTHRIELLGCQNSQISHSNLLVLLSKINLSQLKILSLSCNQIGSVEALAKLASPLLMKLSLDGNCITYIRSLRKATFPHLTDLNLEDNPVRDIDVLWECPFPLLENMQLESFGGENTHQCLGWLAKMQNAILGELGLAGGGRIRQKSMLSMLGRKYRSLFIELDEEGSASE